MMPAPADAFREGPLGEYLWDLRQATGMSLRDVEKASGQEYRTPTSANWKRGKSQPLLLRIAP